MKIFNPSLIFFLFPLLLPAQTDTTALTNGTRPLSAHERSIKSDLDVGLRKGADWRGLLKTVSYGSDCPDVFQYEYLVRLGLASAATPLEGDMNFFTKGCECGNRYLVRKGIEEGIDLDIPYGQFRETPLILAIFSGNVENANLLLERTRNINALTHNQRNALDMAAQYMDDTLFVKKLLEHGADAKMLPYWNTTPLERAYCYNKNVFNYLYRYYMAVEDTTFWRHSRLAETCIANGDTTDAKRYLPICTPWVTPEKNLIYLDAAAEFAVLYSLLNSERTPYGDTSLPIYYTKDLDIAMFRFLRRCGYDLNITDSLGRNILYKCRDLPFVVRALIEEGTDPNQLDVDGRTVLDYYVREIIKPRVYDFGITKEQDRDYRPELDLLAYYTEHGAHLGNQTEAPWCLLHRLAVQQDNRFLLKYLKKYYKGYIKTCATGQK